MEPEPWGLPLNETLLPEHLNKLGYVSHAVGKWHLGYFKKPYTPTYRGFKSFYGFWNGYQDYYTHTVQATVSEFNMDLVWSTCTKNKKKGFKKTVKLTM